MLNKNRQGPLCKINEPRHHSPVIIWVRHYVRTTSPPSTAAARKIKHVRSVLLNSSLCHILSRDQ